MWQGLRSLRPDLCPDRPRRLVGDGSSSGGRRCAGGRRRAAGSRAGDDATSPDPETLLAFECTVLLKVGPVLGALLALLERLDLLGHAVYVRRCGQPEQHIVTDLRAAANDFPNDYFALLIVHRR